MKKTNGKEVVGPVEKAGLPTGVIPGGFRRGVKDGGFAVTRDGVRYNGNVPGYTPVKACLIEVEFLSNEDALNSVKLPGNTGVAIKDTFAENAAADIFNNFLNQP